MHEQIFDVDATYVAHKNPVDAPEAMFQIPRASIWNVLEVVTEYDLQSLPKMLEPRVLDIGANVGTFAIACCHLWPSARVMSFEPHPETFRLLRGNVAGMAVEVHNQAILGWDRSLPVMLHEGKRNRLCCGVLDVGDQDMSRGIIVTTMLAAELPPCDVLKVDTEGCEVEILEGYRHLGASKVLLVEIHGATSDSLLSEGQRVGSLAAKAGLIFKDQRANTLRFVRHA